MREGGMEGERTYILVCMWSVIRKYFLGKECAEYNKSISSRTRMGSISRQRKQSTLRQNCTGQVLGWEPVGQHYSRLLTTTDDQTSIFGYLYTRSTRANESQYVETVHMYTNR